MPATVTTQDLFAKLREQAGKIAELELIRDALVRELAQAEAALKELTPGPDAEPPEDPK